MNWLLLPYAMLVAGMFGLPMTVLDLVIVVMIGFTAWVGAEITESIFTKKES